MYLLDISHNGKTIVHEKYINRNTAYHFMLNNYLEYARKQNILNPLGESDKYQIHYNGCQINSIDFIGKIVEINE